MPVSLNYQSVLERLLIIDEDDAELMRAKFEEAQELARPKGLCRVAYVEDINDDEVTIDGITFTSKLLAKNLKDVHRVFAYVLTCGSEIDEWSHKTTDPVEVFWLDQLKEMYLGAAHKPFFDTLIEKYQLSHMASMNPGSGDVTNWPISQQRQLFQLIGGVDEIGVRLTDTCLMLPTKSISGLYFTSETAFSNCAFCTRENCPNRKTPSMIHG